MADRPPLWIVDGDNVAHLRGEPSDDYRLVRADTVAAVVELAARSGEETVIVFDGHGQAEAIGPAGVRFAAAETADTVIERLAHRHQVDRDVTVVSNDTVLRHVAQRGGGVHVLSAREYVARLAAATARDRPASRARQRFQVGDAVDPAVRAALERLRRGG